MLQSYFTEIKPQYAEYAISSDLCWLIWMTRNALQMNLILLLILLSVTKILTNNRLGEIKIRNYIISRGNSLRLLLFLWNIE